LGNKIGALPDAITTYHGSPHDFDEFDMSKIGTGEGAQAYGRGLYFAEMKMLQKSIVITFHRRLWMALKLSFKELAVM
jgi:hypothetical protein